MLPRSLRKIAFLTTVLICDLTGRPANDPVATLSKADELADIYNWQAAAPFYQQAERDFRGAHDHRDAMYANIGYLRATFESRSFAETSAYLSNVCDEPIVKSDLKLSFKCWVAKADTDAEIDSAPAEADWHRVLILAHAAHDTKWENRALGEIGFHRYVQGDHTAAKRDTAIALLHARNSGDWPAQIRFASGIGTGLVLAGFEGMGAPYIDTAIDLAKQHPESGYPYMAVAGKIMALIKKSDYAQAETFALQASNRAKSDRRLVKYTQAQLFLADVAIGRGQRDNAISILTATIEVAKHNKTRLLREAYSKLSDLYREQGNLKVAEKFSNYALLASQDSHDMYLVPSILLIMARINIAEHRAASADALLQRATDVIEGMLAHTTETRARDAMLATMSEVFRTHFALAAVHGDVTQAFSIIEQVRGRFVSELLVNKKQLREVDSSNAELESSISALKLRLVKAKTITERRTVADRLFYAEQNRWVSLRNAAIRQPRGLSLPMFRAALGPDEVFLEYVLDDDASWCLVLSKRQARIVQLAGQKIIQKTADGLLRAITQGTGIDQPSNALFRYIIDPLGDLSRYKTISISPDDVLTTIPFEVLRTPSNQFFGVAKVISYTPSAGSQMLLRRTRPTDQRTFLGIAGVPYDLHRPAATTLALNNRGGGIDPYDTSNMHNLPTSEEEVKTAALEIGAKDPTFVLGPAATKEAFEKADLGEYSVIHFAVHARANIVNPDESYLLLSTAPPSSDGFLEPRDIMKRDLHSAVVVLSACDTAVGHVQGEEGVANISRSFLIAGSSSVISTLWSVDDSYSLFLTKAFYDHLGRGEPAAVALQAGKMAVLSKFGQETPPKYWAGFILTGNGEITLPTAPPERSQSAQLSEEINDARNHH